MSEPEKKEERAPAADHKRDRPEALATLPGIRRYQFFSDLSDRAPTRNLNRLAMLGIATALGVDVLKPVANDVAQTLYCYECRACYATQDRCPAGITFQAELTVAARVADYERFLAARGLSCVRCGNCVSYCAVNLNLPKIFARMQALTMVAMRSGKIPRSAVLRAFREGAVGRAYIDDVARWLGEA